MKDAGGQLYMNTMSFILPSVLSLIHNPPLHYHIFTVAPSLSLAKQALWYGWVGLVTMNGIKKLNNDENL